MSIQDSLISLHRIGFIALGDGADGKRYGRIAKFDSHQVVNRPTPSKIKAIEIVWEDSQQTHGIVSESSVPERNREQGKEQGRERATVVAMPTPAKPKKRRPEQTPMPADFGISERVRAWAAQKGFGRLDEHLDSFRRKVSAKGYVYANWDDAFMEAIREDWAKLRAGGNGFRGAPDLLGSEVPRTARRLGSDQ